MNHCRRKHIRCRLMPAGFKIKSEVKKNAIFQLVSILSAPKMDVLFLAMSLRRDTSSSKVKIVAGTGIDAASDSGAASGLCKQELNDQNSVAGV